MGEYLELVTNKDDTVVRRLLNIELGTLAERLPVRDGRITTKLATCEDVFFTFKEMKQLHTFIHDGNDGEKLVQNHRSTGGHGPGL